MAAKVQTAQTRVKSGRVTFVVVPMPAPVVPVPAVVAPVPAPVVPVPAVVVPVPAMMSAAAPIGSYEVSAILDHRWCVVRRDWEFKTQYTGYEANPSWQPVWDFMYRGEVTNSVLKAYMEFVGIVLA